MNSIKPRRPTQVDVALRAGVSRATVSLVLNQTGSPVPIGEETRERVLAAAREIGYAPNPVAQMLARGSNHIIGFLSFDDIFLLAESDFYYPYLVGVQREAGEQNYHILLLRNNSSVYENGMNSLLLADGSILTGTDPDSRVLSRLAQENYPFVLLGECDSLKGNIDSVQSDHEPASYAATRHLLDMDHRNLGIVVEEMSLPHHRQRLTGCERAINEISDARLTILSSKDLISPKKFAAILRKNQITGLLCGERDLTHPTVNLIQQLLVRVPEDLSIVFLSTTWGVPYNNPTRVNLNRDFAGQVAVQRLVQRLEGQVEGFERILIPCDFISGETTGPVNPSV
jgi:DNA-binding LacI/PurR family transcriptional regulator